MANLKKSMTPNATKDKSQGDSKKGNNTITDVPKDQLKDQGVHTKEHTGKTVAGDALSPASSNRPDVAPVVKQNQDTSVPAISMVPPVYGHAGIKDVTKAKNDWQLAEAQAEARYGLAVLNSKTREQQKELIEEEYRRTHNGSLDEDKMTTHVGATLDGISA